MTFEKHLILDSQPASDQPVEEDQPITEEPGKQASNGGGVSYENEMKTTPI